MRLEIIQSPQIVERPQYRDLTPQIYPKFIPLGRAESHPNVSGSGFIDESHYTGPGTRLQSLRNRSEVRVAGVMKRFGRLKTEINEGNIDKIPSHFS